MEARFVLTLVAFCFLSQAVEAQQISFNRDVRQIISDKCYHCHGPDADNQESDYRLDTRDHALDAIEEGSPDDSELIARIYSDDEGDVMPPPEATRQLSESEKEILKRWIEQGAPFEGHWAFEPIPDDVEVPNVETQDWGRSEIDSFIFRSMKEVGLNPNKPATKEKWLRRVTYDLTGLPPTLEQLDSFLADESEAAHEKVVDRLLASDECAERLASEWLDVARYSDSYGYQRDDERYVWPYRDWVIRAFKQNLPYDKFVTWQLAGDLLEQPTRDQIIATAFNRLHSHKKEGGVAVEEFRVENVADRTHTFSAAFMGLTMECARCHDHKYDPLKMKEYYQLSSFFANVDENGLISYFTDAVPTPAAPLPTADQEKQLAEAARKVEAAEKELFEVFESEEKKAHEWQFDPARPESVPGLIASLTFDQPVAVVEKKKEKDKKGKEVDVPIVEEQFKPGVDSRTLEPWDKTAQRVVEGVRGKAVELTGDDPIDLPGLGRFERHDPFSVSIWIKVPEVEERAVIWRRSRGWDDAGSVGYELTKIGDRLTARMCHFWPGNAISVVTDSFIEMDRWYHVAVTYDGSSKASGLRIYVDGEQAKTQIEKDNLTRQVSRWRGGYDDFAIGTRYRDRGFKDGQVDEFRMYDRELASIEVMSLFNPDRVATDHHRSSDDVRDWYHAAFSKPAAEAREKLRQARADWNKIMDSIPAMTVMRETEEPRDVFMLDRGVYDARTEKVEPETPAFLPEYPEDAPRNRLGLAKWITSPDHPLLARVTVNRYWQMMFANGLVRTPEDFGFQSEVPSHPELLDWLSRDFISNGWDVRRMLKIIALSATYRQSADVPREVRDRDPENKWLARSPGNRLTAEMLRDGVLFAAGQLNQKIGGPPVKPYDVALAYNPLTVDTGEKLYRRSLYTFWKRSSPAPVMMTMNASKRDVCRLRREVTASPLQALVLLNGTQFVESSKVLAAKLHEKHDGNLEAMIRESFRLMTSRIPTEVEVEILKDLYTEQIGEFNDTPDNAKELLETGEARLEGDVSDAEIAAATVLVNAILNLDESVRLR